MSLRPLPDSVDGDDAAVSDRSETRRNYPNLLLQESASQQTQERTQSLIRIRTQYISDADASSDFSEMDIHRDNLSDDFSDYETQFGGRWDLAAHWHLADYSEGVEGDADDDDDEERDNDTDLSEGLGRAINIDLGRVREILGSSPSSTPIVFPRLLRLGSRIGTEGLRLNSLLTSRNAEFDSNSSTSEELEDNQSRAHQTSTTPSSAERTVRFSWDLQETHSRHALHETVSTTYEPNTTSTLDDHDTHSTVYHENLDDIQNRGNTQSEELSHTQSGNIRGVNGSINNDSANRSQTNSNPRSTSSGRGENSPLLRTQETTRQSSSSIPQATNIDQTNFRTGGVRIYAYQNPFLLPNLAREERRSQHRYPSSTISPRQSHPSSSRGLTSPYWSIHNRQNHILLSSSPLSSPSSSPSPISSNSSSRIASPTPEHSSTSTHKPDEEGICQLDLEFDTQQCRSNTSEGNVTGVSRSTLLDKLDAVNCILSTSATSVENIESRRSISTNISSLPSFASSVFSPGNYYGRVDSLKTLGIHGSHRSNHPRRQCCFLQPGQKFSGTQNLRTQVESLTGMRSRQQEEWNVNVTISSVDYEAGVIYGLMEAIGVPMSASNVITFWEGEIIDFENHTFWTKKWSAKVETDLEHWKRMEAFQGVDKKYIIKGAKTGKFRGHIDQKYIFMRWKEKHFVNITEHSSGLTIAGFYYVSMRRSDGYVEGYYHDQESTPFQHLTLNPAFETNGYSSSIFEVA